jgi:outer membrane protein TolC
MGIIGPFNYVPVDALDRVALTLNEDELVSLAYRRRPELRSISAQERAADEQVSSLRRQYLPSVSGGAQYSWTGREYPLQEGWLWSVTLTVPLFDSLLTMAQVGEAEANVRSLAAQGDDLRQQVVLEVRQGVLNVRESEERIRVSEITTVQATENLALAEGRYSAGVGNIIEVTDAQTSLTSARATHLQAQYNYKTALAQLEQAVGQPLE